PAHRRAARGHGLLRRADHRRTAGGTVHPGHRRWADREPPARRPDDRRRAELPWAARMSAEIGRGKSGRRAYSLDEIGIVPSRRTRDPEEVSTAWQIDAYRFELPLVC